ncbi:MAG: hypothetical protein LV479_06980 [Methylacidiphilales bacterium]|nr:hypothetical protein [Candidatus Methylacidiphilales bacterium]
MDLTGALPKQRHFGETTRSDPWYLQPVLVFLGFSAFIVYSTWAAFQGLDATHTYFWYGGGGANYLSPFYSPILFGSNDHPGFFGVIPSWWPALLPFSPAFLIMWIPAGFRFTCYYYRGAYYKAFWLDPVNCAVGEPRKSYLGERYLPLILQNVHRYFLYLALIFIFILGRDAWDSLWFTDYAGMEHFGVAVGSLVLILNVILLAGYTCGCHSLRHLVGGFLDAKSKARACATCYNAVSCLNARHMLWAWMSLFWVGFTDVYIRLCAMGIWHDIRFF